MISSRLNILGASLRNRLIWTQTAKVKRHNLTWMRLCLNKRVHHAVSKIGYGKKKQKGTEGFSGCKETQKIHPLRDIIKLHYNFDWIQKINTAWENTLRCYNDGKKFPHYLSVNAHTKTRRTRFTWTCVVDGTSKLVVNTLEDSWTKKTRVVGSWISFKVWCVVPCTSRRMSCSNGNWQRHEKKPSIESEIRELSLFATKPVNSHEALNFITVLPVSPKREFSIERRNQIDGNYIVTRLCKPCEIFLALS